MKLIEGYKSSIKELVETIENDNRGPIIDSLKACGLNHDHFYRRKENPDLWKKSELICLANHLSFDPSAFNAYFLYRKLIQSRIARSGIKSKKLCEMVGLTKWQLHRRYKNEDKFTMEEIERIEKILQLFD